MAQPEKKPIDSGLVSMIANGAARVMDRLRGRGSSDSPAGTEFMGPGKPLDPQQQQQIGRAFDYPVGVNYSITPRATEPISFPQLRALADGYDLLRLIIETRKDQLEKLPWSISPRVKFGEKRKKKTAPDARVDALERFFRYPDQENSWAVWLRKWLEDLFVIDAPALYKRPTRGGGLYAIEIIDGATIKPLLNLDGRTPIPPLPAYQQVIKGIPWADYTTEEMIYCPRNRRSNKIFGFSPVEQILMTVNIALRRQVATLQFYTEGNIPEALIGVPEAWSPTQIKEFQTYWDTILEGNTAQRRHAKFIPGDIAKNYVATRGTDIEQATIFDEWLARVCCFAFSIPPTPFVKMMNRATAETAMREAKEEGLFPLMRYVKNVIDRIIEIDFGISDLEFVWEDDAKTDQMLLAQSNEIYVRSGIKSIDEAREDIGLDPVDMPNAIFGTATLLDDVKNPPEPPPMLVSNSPGDPSFGAGGKPGAKKPGDGDGQNSGGDVADDDEDEDEDEDEGVGKSAGIPFVKGLRVLRPVKRTRRDVKQATARLADRLKPLLRRLGEDVAAQITRRYVQVEKAVMPPDAIIGDLDFGNWAILINPIREEIAGIAESAGMQAIKTIGFSDEGITDQVHEDALDYGRARASELVGMRILDDGSVIPNPRAEWAITESTRETLRGIVTTAIEEGWSTDRLAEEIIGSTEFNESRAEMVARTELAIANSEGAMIGYRATGQVTGKIWLTAGDDLVSEECLENEAAGVIPLDDKFPSGDDAPPVHPNCRCDVAPVIADEE